MKILIMTLGTRGDVQPFLPLGEELKRRGHDVIMFSTRHYRYLIEEAGLRANCSQVASHEYFDLNALSGGARNPRLWWPIWRGIWRLLVRQTQEMWRVGQEVAPDIIVYHPFCVPAPSLARDLGIQAVPVFLQPAFDVTGDYPNPLAGPRNYGRAVNRLSNAAILGAGKGFARLVLRAMHRDEGRKPARPYLDPLAGYGAGGLRLHAYSPSLVTPPV